MNIKEEQVLIPALTKFTEITGIEAMILRTSEGKKASLDVIIEISKGQQRYILEVDVKSEIRTAALSSILSKQKAIDGKLLMVSKYIPAPMKDELKSYGINYIEGSGNCYIETRGIYVYVNDQKATPLKRTEETKLWAPSGMKFLFAVLMDQELLNSSYRNIAYAAGVALGNIGSFINELKREGYVILGTRQKQEMLLLENRMMLIEKWADMYRNILRPKQMIGRFRFNKKEGRENWHSQVGSDIGIYWGGETAGAILTEYLSPQVYTIYSNEDRFELMRKLKIVPDQSGEVEILRPFWNEELFSTDGDTVPPLLAYAELISSFDSRNRETAIRIKEKYVK
ncbi:MAG: type IV toxin-antitoxin system AbiEi family antitoxin [Sphingobacteriaceae bacterium]